VKSQALRKTFLVQPFFEEGGGWDDWGLYPGTEEQYEAAGRDEAIAAYLEEHGPLYSVLDWKVKEL
jgi:hypothetical protein